MPEQPRCIGSITRTHGFNGEIVFRPFADEKYSFRKGDVLFLETGGDRVPFFVSGVKKGKGYEMIISFEDVASQKAAQALCKSEVYSDRKPSRTSPARSANEFIGYSLEDITLGHIAIVENVISMPSQIILQLYSNEKEILVPLHPDLVIDIDRKKKILKMNLPEGLIAGYLE